MSIFEKVIELGVLGGRNDFFVFVFCFGDENFIAVLHFSFTVVALLSPW